MFLTRNKFPLNCYIPNVSILKIFCNQVSNFFYFINVLDINIFQIVFVDLHLRTPEDTFCSVIILE